MNRVREIRRKAQAIRKRRAIRNINKQKVEREILPLFSNSSNIRQVIHRVKPEGLITLSIINEEELYKPYLTLDKTNMSLSINIDIGGLPGRLCDAYISPEAAVQLLEQRNIRSIRLDYRDRWELLPPPPFASYQDLSDLLWLASKEPNCFINLLGLGTENGSNDGSSLASSYSITAKTSLSH